MRIGWNTWGYSVCRKKSCKSCKNLGRSFKKYRCFGSGRSLSVSLVLFQVNGITSRYKN